MIALIKLELLMILDMIEKIWFYIEKSREFEI